MSLSSVEGRGESASDVRSEPRSVEESLHSVLDVENVATQVCTQKTALLSPTAKRHRVEEQTPPFSLTQVIGVEGIDKDARLDGCAPASSTATLPEPTHSVDELALGAVGVVDVSDSTAVVEADVTGVSDDTLAEESCIGDPACGGEAFVSVVSISADESSNLTQPPQALRDGEHAWAPEQSPSVADRSAGTPPAIPITNQDEEVALAETPTHLSQSEGPTGSSAITPHGSDSVMSEGCTSHSQVEEELRGNREAQTATDAANCTQIPSLTSEECEHSCQRQSRPSGAATPPVSVAAVEDNPKAPSKHLTFADSAFPPQVVLPTSPS
ncbi:hypothetical protein JKF63_04353 [Porcisia hertigi]|uniref:Uncharacterized protein n=1 Tax=Porcisia hertigi TaxID=2761500 RepID=A0A836LC79_9TRYP|nr:hypothetical protein JKF63_04353 [Porcisia hertigi]